jgi:MSHA biogenesis protein MshM
MYLEHFGLNSAPFNITSQTDFFFNGAARGDTLAALVYAVQQGEGIVKVTGEVGSGKTMLCRMLLESLPDNVETIFLSVPSLKRDEIMEALCIELGIPIEGQARYQLLTALQQKLIELYASDRRLVALIDEAHAMPLESLEEIRLLTNLENGDHKLLQIVLFGQPELDDHLRLTHMRQLKERITHSFHLGPLQKSDIGPYLTHRLGSAGYQGPDLFSAPCVKLISHASTGLTRRVNIIADKSLLAAYANNTRNVTPDHVRAAIRDSDFPLPTQWGKRALFGAATLAAAAVISFGLIKTSGLNNPKTQASEAVAILPATTAQEKSAPLVLAERKPESQPGAELIVGSPEWHEKNINKNNGLSKSHYSGSATSQNNSTSLNAPQNVASPSNSAQIQSKTTADMPKTGFELDPKASDSERPKTSPAEVKPIESNVNQNTAIAANSVNNGIKNNLDEKKLAENPTAKTVELKVPPNKPPENATASDASLPKHSDYAPNNLQGRIVVSKTWLDAQPASQCFIQLLIADMNNHDNVGYFLKTAQQQLGTQKVFVFPSEINGQAKYIVVYANFSDGLDCQGALQKLPAPLKQSKPYIRTVELLRNEVKFPG